MHNPHSDSGIIDFSKEIYALQEKHGKRFRFNKSYYQELAQLWGLKVTNEHGDSLDSELETVVSNKSCSGKIDFVETSKGYWLIGVSAQTSISGSSYAPSVSAHIGYTSKAAARNAGLKEIRRHFQGEAVTKNSCASHSHTISAQQAVKQIDALLTQPELELF